MLMTWDILVFELKLLSAVLTLTSVTGPICSAVTMVAFSSVNWNTVTPMFAWIGVTWCEI